MNAALEVAALRVERAGHLLLTADFAVAAGELAVLVGAPGAGASTLAATIAGAVPGTGSVRVAGRILRGGPARRRRAGLAACLPDLDAPRGCSVAEALTLAARDRGAAGAMLERLPLLAERSGLAAGLLSGGETQLLRVACAMAGSPMVLVLDSPTAGLADSVAEEVRGLARDQAARGAAVLWLDGAGGVHPAPPRLRIEDAEVRG